MVCAPRSLDQAAEEARFEVTEEFARDAYKALTNVVEPELEELRRDVDTLKKAAIGGAAAAGAAAALAPSASFSRSVASGSGNGADAGSVAQLLDAVSELRADVSAVKDGLSSLGVRADDLSEAVAGAGGKAGMAQVRTLRALHALMPVALWGT